MTMTGSEDTYPSGYWFERARRTHSPHEPPLDRRTRGAYGLEVTDGGSPRQPERSALREVAGGESRASRAPRRGFLPWPGWPRVLCLLLFSFGVACGPGIQVQSSYDETAAFADYRTFAMVEPDRAVPTDPEVDPFFMQKLRRMVRDELRRRGLRQVAPGEADLRVGVMAVVRGRVVVYPSSFGYGYRWGSPWGGYDVRQYDEGTIVVDLIDARRRAVIWRGTGTRVVTSRTSTEDLREVVLEILADYPPQPEAP